MRKAGIAVATIILAGAFVVPALGTESLVRKADVADKSFEAFLPLSIEESGPGGGSANAGATRQ